jgi:hypothetical protein
MRGHRTFRGAWWWTIGAVALAAGAGLAARDTGYAATPLLPDMRALPASDLRLETPGDGHTYLRLSATTWNGGDGPLELAGGQGDALTGKQQVYQRIYNDDGSSTLVLAGTFQYHPAHQHVHFDDYALYTLQPVDAPGGSDRTASKTTFCIIDTTRVKRLPGSPKQPVYGTCGSTVQGMSKGWGDTYPYYLAGQAIDITGLPDGTYRLTIEADYKNRIVELDETNNVSALNIELANGTVPVLDRKQPRP